MARLRESILRWGNKYDGPNNYKNNRRGASEDAFWDEYELVDHRRGGTKKKRKRKRGCPENNYKGHVYVWEREVHRLWNNDTYVVDVKRCCGCLVVNNKRYHW